MWIARSGILASSGVSNTLNTNVRNTWNFDNAATDSVGSLTATLMNGCTYTSSGKMGQALTFDGVNDYALLPDNSLNLTGDFTISMWVYPTSGLTQCLLDNLAYTAGSVYKGWQLDINNISGAQSGKITFAIPQGPGGSVGTFWQFNTTALTNNAWNHILLTRVSGVNTYCWVNNISQGYTLSGSGANITTNPSYHTTQHCTIGAFKFLNGTIGNYVKAGTLIDATTIWSRQLTTTERNDLYNGGAGKQYLFV